MQTKKMIDNSYTGPVNTGAKKITNNATQVRPVKQPLEGPIPTEINKQFNQKIGFQISFDFDLHVLSSYAV